MTPNSSKPVLELVQYTDPYCTWCWGSEPILRRIKVVFGGQVKQRFVAGGLVRDMRQFFDGTNDIGGPNWYAAVAAHWLEASSRHGMPVDQNVFYDQKDEVFSTYPACVAYKSAQLQGEDLGQRYLRRIREAAAAERRIIQHLGVQIQLAEEIGLDSARFQKDIESGDAERAFEADLQECRAARIRSFPTFLVRHAMSDAKKVLVGYQRFEKLADAIRDLAPLSEETVQANDKSIVDFVRTYEKVTPREVAEVFQIITQDAKDCLDRLTANGELQRLSGGNGHFYVGR
jgi:putative protein-disulfide isomerase